MRQLDWDRSQDNAPTAAQQNEAYTSFWADLLQSQVSFDDVLLMVQDAYRDNTFLLPPSPSRHNVVNAFINSMSGTARLMQPSQESYAVQHRRRLQMGRRHVYGPPPTPVPASPWTTLLEDEDISYYISLFLTFLNPYMRVVEEDIFLQDMRSQDLDSKYCSSFLVHTILSFTAVS